MAVEVKEEEQKFKLIEVATQTEKVITTPEGNAIQIDEAIVICLNKLDEIKKYLG